MPEARSPGLDTSSFPTQAVLTELDDREIGFITLRARHPGVTRQLAALPATAWASLTFDRAKSKTSRNRAHDDGSAANWTTSITAAVRPGEVAAFGRERSPAPVPG